MKIIFIHPRCVIFLLSPRYHLTCFFYILFFRSIAFSGSSQGASFRTLVAHLPRQAYNVYYRDQIGNISSSDMTFRKDNIVFEIDTRFPIFGGWQTEFYIGYSVPTETMLRVDEATERYTLAVDFFTNFQGVWIEDMELKVVLPEGCKNIDVNVPYQHERSDSIRYTYFDSKWNGGRPVIIISAKNLVKEHSEKVTISYNFSKIHMVVEPFMLIACFFCVFVIFSALSRVNQRESLSVAADDDSNCDEETKKKRE